MRRACLLALVVLPLTACWGGSDASDGAARATPVAVAAKSATVAADSLANTRIGGPYGTVLAFRFRAAWTGQVRGVRFYVVRNSDGRTGYSGGTGGTLRIALTRDADGFPDTRRGALAAATLEPPRRDAWPLVRFGRPAHVTRDHLYHVVFTNLDARPLQNYVSVNALVSYDQRDPAPGVPHGLAVSLSDARDGGRTPGRWTSRIQRPGDRYVPIVEVVGGRHGEHLGLGYMEVWVNNPKPIGGGAKVRQLLPDLPARAVTGAWLRVRRRGDARAALQLRIERTGGRVLTAARVRAGAVRRDAPGWVHVRFRRRVALDGDLALVAASSAPSAYEAFAIRKGTEFGFDDRTVLDGGYAQFTQAGRWVGWDQWGGRDLHTGDLQFALGTAPR